MKIVASSLILLLVIVVGVGLFVNRQIGNVLGEWIPLKSNENRAADWSFAVIGDPEGTRDITKTMLTELAKEDVAFVVQLGDLAGGPSEEKMKEVLALFAQLPMPVHHIPGNNDLIYNETLERKTLDLYKQTVNPITYSSFDYNNAHIVLLDNSYRRDGFTNVELEWLRTDLDAHTLPYLFLMYHRPIELPAEQLFGDDETPHSREQNNMFVDLITQYPVTRIFNGHLHFSYNYLLRDIPVTISGGGGATPQSFLGGEAAANYHYTLVHLYNDGSAPTIEVRSFNN